VSRLTANQRKAYRLIKEYMDKHRMAPTVRELSSMMGLSSSACGHRYFKKLQEAGLIKKVGHRAVEILR
jgi:repressor LexA